MAATLEHIRDQRMNMVQTKVSVSTHTCIYIHQFTYRQTDKYAHIHTRPDGLKE
jgi:hypothetical protein